MFNIIKKYDEADSMSRRVDGLRDDLRSSRIKDDVQLTKTLLEALDKASTDIEKLRSINYKDNIDEYVNTAFEIDCDLHQLDIEINGTWRQQFERAMEEAIADGSYKDPFAEK